MNDSTLLPNPDLPHGAKTAVAISETKSFVSYAALLAFCLTIIVLVVPLYLNRAPQSFTTTAPLVVENGSTVRTIARTLKSGGFIRSTTFFALLATVTGSAQELKAGEYTFTEPHSAVELLSILRDKAPKEETVRLTIPEGSTARDIALIVESALPELSATTTYAVLKESEGYLFPETYHILPRSTPAEIKTLLTTTFDERVRTHLTRGDSPPLHDIVIMASILEREGNTKENMAIISGILAKRLAINMPLQVDATLEYERGLGSKELSTEDLTEDSPFNTYTRKGLPPAPIANPGDIALSAAVNPASSPYLFYLTGDDGVFYYATTYEEHKQNKARYIK
jgi:UPF0755 protein